MKKLGKTPLIIIAVIAAILVIVAIVLVVTKNSGNDDRTAANTSQPPAVTATNAGYNVSGVWYSDQSNSDTLTLNKDGSYSSSWWLASGNYVVQGEIISLTDTYGTTKTLLIQKVGTEYVLFFDNANKSHFYYRTQKEVEAAQQEQEQQNTEMQRFYVAALSQILTTGTWKDNLDSTTLTFTDTDYTAVNKSAVTGKEETTICQYVVTDVSAENDVYKVKWTMTDSNGTKFEVTDVTITVNGNSYTLYTSSLPYARTFTKTVDIVFTQPTDPTPSSSVPANQIDATGNSGQPAEITTSTQVTRNDNPDESEHQSEIEAAVMREIIGTWKGTFDEITTSNTVYWLYTFTSDGKYTFSNGDINESGAYTVTHNAGNKYHSTLHLVPTAGEERTVNFYLSGSRPVALTVEGDTDPTYKKN